MKNRSWIYFFTLVLAMLAILFWLHSERHESILQQVQKSAQHSNETKSNNSEMASPTASNPPTNSSAQRIVATIQNDPQKFHEKLREIVDKKNKPIEFYGKVIDQDSNSITGANIKIGIRQWYIPVPDFSDEEGRTIHLEQTSDANGRFEFHGATGDGFGVGITKDGYLSPPNARYGFGPQAGAYENPVIFKMWKMNEKENLVSGSKFLSITPDGQGYTIDFLQQGKVESDSSPGDIRISITRPAQLKPHAHFDWSFSIEAKDGGLIKTDDDFMYLAPESGYQPTYSFAMSSTNANWKRELDGIQFYLKSRAGQVYGNFKFDLIPDYNAVSIFNVSWSVNPNGSRNLQP